MIEDENHNLRNSAWTTVLYLGANINESAFDDHPPSPLSIHSSECQNFVTFNDWKDSDDLSMGAPSVNNSLYSYKTIYISH